MNLHFAFAVNKNNQFEDHFFGDADKFLIYKVISGELKLTHEIVNEFKYDIKENSFQKRERTENLIKYLLGNDVKVIVSKQFGENIKIGNGFFIPVIISKENPEEAVGIINEYLHWIEDELNNLSSGKNMFWIRCNTRFEVKPKFFSC